MQLTDIYVRLLSSWFYDYNCFSNLGTTWAFLSCISSCYSASHSTQEWLRSWLMKALASWRVTCSHVMQNLLNYSASKLRWNYTLPDNNLWTVAILLQVNDQLYLWNGSYTMLLFFISLLGMKSGYLDIGELVHILSDQGRQNIVTALDVAMPAPSLTGTR